METSHPSLREIVDQALADKELTREEQRQIMEAVLEDQQVSMEEHELLEKIMDMITSGEVKVVD